MRKILLVAIILTAAIAFVFYDTAEQGVTVNEPELRVESVPVYEFKPVAKQDVVVAYGQAQARWSVSLRSEATGRVLHVSEEALVGALVSKGDELAVIEDTAQRLALSNEMAALAEASRVLAEEQQRSRLAEANWRSGGYKDEPDPLVVRQPQLAEAMAKKQSAELAVERAQYLLEQTRIVAPFNGAITKRSVSSGDFVQQSNEVVQMYDTSSMEVVLPVTEADIVRLNGVEGAQVLLGSDQLKHNWIGTVERIGQSVDVKNQWINLIVSISDPDGLVPGQFLRAEITGTDYQSVIGIPESLIGRDGAIWWVDTNNLMHRISITPLFSNNNLVFVTPEVQWEGSLHLAPPRSSYLDGIEVSPEFVTELENPDLAASGGGIEHE